MCITLNGFKYIGIIIHIPYSLLIAYSYGFGLDKLHITYLSPKHRVAYVKKNQYFQSTISLKVGMERMKFIAFTLISETRFNQTKISRDIVD